MHWLRKAGLTHREIGEVFGISKESAEEASRVKWHPRYSEIESKVAQKKPVGSVVLSGLEKVG